MQKKQNTKFRVTDLLIIFLCCAGAAASLWFFWTEYNRTLVKLNEEPVGVVVFRLRTAHRKIEDRAAWDRLKQESPVYNGDTIRTAELSEAVVTFRDQITRVELSEDTMIQIFYSEEGAHIGFSGGNLNINAGSGTVVSSGASVFELTSASRADFSGGDAGMNISVLEGGARLNGAELRSGAVLSLKKNGEQDAVPAIAMTSFAGNARILGVSGEKSAVTFSWNSVNFNDDTYVVVEVAEDKSFGRIKERREVKGASSVSIPLDSGDYWWRAVPVEKDAPGNAAGTPGRPYPQGRVEVVPQMASVLFGPVNAEEVAGGAESRIPLSWSAVDGAVAYLVEIAADETMRNPAVSRRVQGTSVTQTGLGGGRWYWRVTPVFPATTRGGALASDTGTFTVVRETAPAAPALSFPAEEGRLNVNDGRLSWKYEPNVSWIVQIADTRAMEKLLVDEVSSVNYYFLAAAKLAPDKTYYWRVAAAKGGASAVSAVRSFTAEADSYDLRVTFPPDNYRAASLGEIRFSCRSNAPRTVIQISRTADFAAIAAQETAAAQNGSLRFSAALEPGVWYWRAAAGPEGKPPTITSVPRTLDLVSSAAPRITGTPPADALKPGDPVAVQWDRSGYSLFLVSIYNTENPERPLGQPRSIENNSVIITAPESSGLYLVSVRGVVPESALSQGITGEPAELRFTVVSMQDRAAQERAALAAAEPPPPAPVSRPEPPPVPPAPPAPVQTPAAAPAPPPPAPPTPPAPPPEPVQIQPAPQPVQPEPAAPVIREIPTTNPGVLYGNR